MNRKIKSLLSGVLCYFILLILSVVLAVVNPIQGVSTHKVQQGDQNELDIENVVCSDTFTLIKLDTLYSKNGELSYDVVFKSSDLGVVVRCNIPKDFASKLKTGAKYEGDISVSYCKDYYIQYQPIDNISDALKKRTSGFVVTNVQFLYSKFIENEFESTDTASEKIKEQVNQEESKLSGYTTGLDGIM